MRTANEIDANRRLCFSMSDRPMKESIATSFQLNAPVADQQLHFVGIGAL
jgi:hypothetical protein